jgi:hypothetical protein
MRAGSIGDAFIARRVSCQGRALKMGSSPISTKGLELIASCRLVMAGFVGTRASKSPPNLSIAPGIQRRTDYGSLLSIRLKTLDGNYAKAQWNYAKA